MTEKIDPGTPVRVEWSGEPHPDGRLARLIRYNRNGKPVVQLYYYGCGADRVIDGMEVKGATTNDSLLAYLIDQALEYAENAGPRSRQGSGQ
jgi:hypothetical protein